MEPPATRSFRLPAVGGLPVVGVVVAGAFVAGVVEAASVAERSRVAASG